MRSIRILSGEDVDAVVGTLTPDTLITLMKTVFSTLSLNSTADKSSNSNVIVCPPRTTVQSSRHSTLFMPSRIAAAGGSGIKIVSVPKDDSDTNGLPAMSLLMNEVTGSMDAVVNARQLTAVRNAAGVHNCATVKTIEEILKTCSYY